MSTTHSISYTWGNGTSTLSSTISATADSELKMDIAAANMATTNVSLALPAADIMSCYILPTQAVTVTFTFSSGSLVLTLPANTPYIWITGNGFSTPFTSNVTALSIVNGTANNATVSFRMLVNY